MASTSTSPSARRAVRLLRLTDRATGQATDFALLAHFEPAGLDLACEGTVHESHAYDAALVTDAALDAGPAVWSVNGEGPLEVDVRPVEGCTVRAAGADCHVYQLLPCDARQGWTPFSMTYGFAAVQVALPGPDGGRLELSTRDIACVCDKADQEGPICAMLDELVDRADPEVVGWMLGPGEDAADRNALVQADGAAAGSESLAALLDLADDVLKTYEADLGFFCSRAFSKTVKAGVEVRPSQLHRLGRPEVLWLARNPDVLHEVDAPTAVRVGAAHYLPSRVRTERPVKTFDGRENRAVLAFIGEVASTLGEVAGAVRDRVGELRQMEERLGALDTGAGLMPSLLVVRACLAREAPLAERACRLASGARRLHAALVRALPQVEAVRYRMPKRTKPFQEIPAYIRAFALMERWAGLGDVRVLRDGLALHTWRMDKLYEYYVLYRLLRALRQAGFRPDGGLAEPFERVEYSLRSRYFDNERQVANVYRLARGEERVALYYQPVFYGDAREEHGVDLHRTTLNSFGLDSYWTPDYLLVHDCWPRRRRIVLDAKFRRAGAVAGAFGAQAGEARSCMEECLRKYRLETLAADGAAVDAMWLLCGRAVSGELSALQRSSWARAREGLVPDGVATVAPGADKADEVLALLGLGATEGPEVL